jgi:hypothetical protein
VVNQTKQTHCPLCGARFSRDFYSPEPPFQSQSDDEVTHDTSNHTAPHPNGRRHRGNTRSNGDSVPPPPRATRAFSLPFEGMRRRHRRDARMTTASTPTRHDTSSSSSRSRTQRTTSNNDDSKRRSSSSRSNRRRRSRPDDDHDQRHRRTVSATTGQLDLDNDSGNEISNDDNNIDDNDNDNQLDTRDDESIGDTPDQDSVNGNDDGDGDSIDNDSINDDVRATSSVMSPVDVPLDSPFICEAATSYGMRGGTTGNGNTPLLLTAPDPPYVASNYFALIATAVSPISPTNASSSSRRRHRRDRSRSTERPSTTFAPLTDIAPATIILGDGPANASSPIPDGSSQSTSPSPPSSSSSTSLPEYAFITGYYKRFFQESHKLGSGGYGGVWLTHHTLDGVELGTYAVKKIPVGDSRPWLLRVLMEVRSLERVHHPNVVDYKHAWLEHFRPSDFGPEVCCSSSLPPMIPNKLQMPILLYLFGLYRCHVCLCSWNMLIVVH